MNSLVIRIRERVGSWGKGMRYVVTCGPVILFRGGGRARSKSVGVVEGQCFTGYEPHDSARLVCSIRGTHLGHYGYFGENIL